MSRPYRVSAEEASLNEVALDLAAAQAIGSAENGAHPLGDRLAALFTARAMAARVVGGEARVARAEASLKGSLRAAGGPVRKGLLAYRLDPEADAIRVTLYRAGPDP